LIEQGSTYGAYVESELNAERERRVAFDARGQVLVGTCGALVTLLAGLVTLTRTLGGQFALSVAAVVFLVAALVALTGAAACGIAAGWNYLYNAPTAVTLERMIGPRWTDDEVDARNHVASARIWTLGTLRAGNNRKARWISAGQVALLVALAALGVTIAVTLPSI
jgi:hypothetical protein